MTVNVVDVVSRASLTQRAPTSVPHLAMIIVTGNRSTPEANLFPVCPVCAHVNCM
jgi:hypothetical protein